MSDNDVTLLQFCTTEHQRDIITRLLSGTGVREISRQLNLNCSTVSRLITNVRKRAAIQGYSPDNDMTKVAPPGYLVKGTSTLYDAEGKPKIQWVKTKLDADAYHAMLIEALETIGETFRGKSKTTAAPKRTRANMLAVIPIGDPHFGMYSWRDETGDDFDCEIAENDLIAATRRVVDAMPSCDQCLILNLGDFFHSDTLENKTRRSGNALDVDTRWQRVMEIGIRAMRECIDHALTRHKHVTVRNNIGNHDEQSSVMLGLALKMYYEKNKRVTVDCSPNPFWFMQFGKCLIGSTHGDRTKPQDLPGIMATDQPALWGATMHRYWYIGHVHHKKIHEFSGAMVESFRTLAAKDAWHNAQGYRAGRDLSGILLHADHGEIERHRVDLSFLR